MVRLLLSDNGKANEWILFFITEKPAKANP